MVFFKNLSQLKSLPNYENIISECDTKIYLDCNDLETQNWMSEILGKKVTREVSFDATSGTTKTKQEKTTLFSAKQLAEMPVDDCIVCIRGIYPFYGKKYELTTHLNYKENKM